MNNENDVGEMNISPFNVKMEAFDADKYSYCEDGTLYDDRKRLLKYDCWESNDAYISDCQSRTNISIKAGTLTICDNAFEDSRIHSLHIPESVCVIGDNALPHNCHIESESSCFIVENGLVLSADRKRILVNCSNHNTIVDIPDSVAFVDSRAFLDVSDESYAWAYDYPPYFLRINNPYINLFPTSYIRIIVPTEDVKQQMIKRGFREDAFVVGNVYVDPFGVVYTHDKKMLLCFPKESSLKTYEIIPQCEALANDSFYWLPDPDEDGLNIIGNKLSSLVLPPNLKQIGNYALQGLTSLKTLLYNAEDEGHVFKMLESYKDYFVNNITKRVELISY